MIFINRILIIVIIIFSVDNKSYSQEGSKIDLNNVSISAERLPTLFLFGEEYTIRERDELLRGILSSKFYLPSLKIQINLQDFISKREFSFTHNGSIEIFINSKKLKNQNKYNLSSRNEQIYQVTNSGELLKLINNVNQVRIDSSINGILKRKVLNREIIEINNQIDRLKYSYNKDTIYTINKKREKELNKLVKSKRQKIRLLDRASLLEINIFTN